MLVVVANLRSIPTDLSLGELRLDGWPSLGLSGITQQVHDDGTLGDSLINLKQVLSWNPTILLGLLPGCAVLPHTDDNVHAIVSKVKTLTVTLRAIANQGKGIVLEVFLYVVSLRFRGKDWFALT